VASGVTATLIDEFCVTDGLQAAVLPRAVVIKRLPRLLVEIDGPKSMKSKVLWTARFCSASSSLEGTSINAGRKFPCPYRKLDSSIAVMQAANQGLGQRRDQTARSVG
jgi:hypothetical protein